MGVGCRVWGVGWTRVAAAEAVPEAITLLLVKAERGGRRRV